MNEAERLLQWRETKVAIASSKAATKAAIKAALAASKRAASAKATTKAALDASNRAAGVLRIALAFNKDANAALEKAQVAYKSSMKRNS